MGHHSLRSSDQLGRGCAIEIFRIEAVPEATTCTLVLSGEADLAVVDDIVELGSVGLYEALIGTLNLDLAAVTFIDSTTISGLIRLQNLAADLDKKMTLANVPPKIERVLKLVGLADHFTLV